MCGVFVCVCVVCVWWVCVCMCVVCVCVCVAIRCVLQSTYLVPYCFTISLQPSYWPNTDVPFIVSLSMAVIQNAPTDTGCLCCKAAVLRNTINGTAYYYVCEFVKISVHRVITLMEQRT